MCQVEFKKDAPGKPEIAAVHQCLRYLFPAEQQREMFLANCKVAAAILAELNPKAQSARSALLKAMNDEDLDVRQWVSIFAVIMLECGHDCQTQ